MAGAIDCGDPAGRRALTHAESTDRAATGNAVARAFREEAGRLTAALVRLLGDFDLAEEAVQDALLAALEHWPADGVPEKPGAWLMTTARRKALDRLRHQARGREKIALLETAVNQPTREPDDRLRLIFTCCHPALAREAQVALTLRAVIGLTTAEIARAFILPEATVAQRIVRAKRKIVEAGIPYRMPEGHELTDRLGEVLAVLYLTYNEGYLSSGGASAARRDLAEDAIWLSGLLTRLMADEPEVLGLHALLRLLHARVSARFDADGGLVLLEHQDRSRWDHGEIREAVTVLERAGRMRRVGPYQLQAAIAACHAEAPSWDKTDWVQIVALYDQLAAIAPTPVVALNRAIALRHVEGPPAALSALEELESALDRYHLYHAARADLLRALGREDEARVADRAALERTTNPAERALLEQRLS
jgi:RNA polymerase sigma factor (sigma-70 family)